MWNIKVHSNEASDVVHSVFRWAIVTSKHSNVRYHLFMMMSLNDKSCFSILKLTLFPPSSLLNRSIYFFLFFFFYSDSLRKRSKKFNSIRFSCRRLSFAIMLNKFASTNLFTTMRVRRILPLVPFLNIDKVPLHPSHKNDDKWAAVICKNSKACLNNKSVFFCCLKML